MERSWRTTCILLYTILSRVKEYFREKCYSLFITKLAIAADVAAGGAHGVAIVGDVARGRGLRHREGGVVRQLTNQKRAFR